MLLLHIDIATFGVDDDEAMRQAIAKLLIDPIDRSITITILPSSCNALHMFTIGNIY